MKDKLKIQTIGWLLLIISLLTFGSMIGYDLTEEPTLVAQKINNPFNILGVYSMFNQQNYIKEYHTTFVAKTLLRLCKNARHHKNRCAQTIY